MFSIITTSDKETRQVGEKLGRLLQSGDLITFSGDLGAGKTTFTKGLAEGLDVKRTVNSPTFTIVKAYQGRVPLYHMDVYRLEDSDEDIGFDDYFSAEGVVVIEWAEFIEDFLPDAYLNIKIDKLSDNERRLSFVATGLRYQDMVKELSNDNFSN